MTANIVPLFRRFHVQLAMGFCLVVTLLTALGRGRLAASEPLAAPSMVAEPVYSSEHHDLLWGDEFDAAPSRISHTNYGRYLTLDARALQHEMGAGVDGSGALRIDWTAADRRRGASCADDSHLLEASFPPTRALTVSFWVRYSPAFVFDWSGRGACSGNAKKLFLLWAKEGSRFVYISENGSLGVGSDHDHPLLAQNGGASFSPAELADGAWHRVTLRVKQGSTRTAADGSVHGWIDGKLRWRYDGIVTHNAAGYYLFKMPATFNAGSPVAQTEWLDRLKIWRDE